MTPARQKELLSVLRECAVCPRSCKADRLSGKSGYCRNDAGLNISAICVHQGEEPALAGSRGICNVFFSHCNLQCRYCQNYQISNNYTRLSREPDSLEAAVQEIEACLAQEVTSVGFVSPSHMVPQMKLIIETLRSRGQTPTFVMNTNAYDTVEALRGLEGYIDVYLPDLKYLDSGLGQTYSDARDYPAVASRALKEMFRQKGEILGLDETGLARQGIILRHLVLPGQVANAKACLAFVAQELSPRLHVSLMSQYTPVPLVAQDPHLGLTLTAAEYDEVLLEMDRLGIINGWVQSLGSARHYQPDFRRSEPFACWM